MFSKIGLIAYFILTANYSSLVQKLSNKKKSKNFFIKPKDLIPWSFRREKAKCFIVFLSDIILSSWNVDWKE